MAKSGSIARQRPWKRRLAVRKVRRIRATWPRVKSVVRAPGPSAATTRASAITISARLASRGAAASLASSTSSLVVLNWNINTVNRLSRQ